jgi:hypothetical protein
VLELGTKNTPKEKHGDGAMDDTGELVYELKSASCSSLNYSNKNLFHEPKLSYYLPCTNPLTQKLNSMELIF